MNTDEGNKLIADFMGYKLHDLGDGKSPYYVHGDKYLKPKAIIRIDKCEALEFHSSWDWLMPVVAKIHSINTIGISMKYKIDEQWDVVVSFISWYNKQPKK